MKSNIELRNLAWQRLWADRWFGRLFGGGLLLGLCGYAVQVVLGGILGRLGVQDWNDYRMAVLMNRVDITSPVPNLTRDYVIRASSATALEMFIGYILSAIAAYGTAVILLRCLKNHEEGWLGAAFGGFRDPFGMLWLFVRLVLIYLGWTLLAVLPLVVIGGVCVPVVTPMLSAEPLLAAVVITLGVTLCLGVFLAVYCIPFYRYRFAFLVKAEHPDWSAGACLRSCKALMEGHKKESFRLDCSYWKPISLILLAVLAALAAMLTAFACKDSVPLAVLSGMAATMLVLVSIAGGIVLAQYIGVGQGFFYQDLKDGQTTGQNERNA